jgi:acrylyl-CoA reductase (NADPH)
MSFRAVVTDGEGPATIVDLDDGDLPDGDVTVDVAYSSLNYKDGLAVSGRGKVVRRFPMICGVDLAGTVSASASPDWQEGDEVVVTGWGLGELHPGGYSGRQRVSSSWLVPRPAGLTLAQTMAVGTAGLTAMLCVLALEDHGLSPQSGGDILVSGAGGGVGSVAVGILAGLGFRVVAGTGRPEIRDYLAGLGAADFVGREELSAAGKRPLESERWTAAVDSVGSTTLATILRQTRYGGAVAACGLAGGPDLPATVLPFILRGVSLLGVDSVQCPTPRRLQAWGRLAGGDLPVDQLDAMTTMAPLADVPRLAEEILAGRTRGRVVIDIKAG